MSKRTYYAKSLNGWQYESYDMSNFLIIIKASILVASRVGIHGEKTRYSSKNAKE